MPQIVKNDLCLQIMAMDFTSYDNYSQLSFLTLFSTLLTNLLFCLQWKKDANRRIHWRPYENSLRKKDRMYICSVKYVFS